MPPGRTGNVSGTYYGLEMTPEEEALLYGDAVPPPPQGGGYASEPQGGNDVVYTPDSPDPNAGYAIQDPAATSQPYQAAPSLPAPESAAYLPSTTPYSPTMDQRASNAGPGATDVLTDLFGPTPTQNGSTYIPASQRNNAGVDNIQQAPELHNRSVGDQVGGAANSFIGGMLNWGAQGVGAEGARDSTVLPGQVDRASQAVADFNAKRGKSPLPPAPSSMPIPAPPGHHWTTDGNGKLIATEGAFDGTANMLEQVNALPQSSPAAPASEMDWLDPSPFGWNPGVVPSAQDQYDTGSSMTMHGSLTEGSAYIPEHPNQGPLVANSALGYGPLPKTPTLPDLDISLPTPAKSKGGYFDAAANAATVATRKDNPAAMLPGGVAVRRGANNAMPPLVPSDGAKTTPAPVATPAPVTTPGDRSGNRSTTSGPASSSRMAAPGRAGFTDVYGTRGGDPALQELKGVLQADGTLDANGNISTQGMTDFKTLGWVDSAGRWTAKANADGAVDGDKVGGPVTALNLRPKGTAKAAAVPEYDPANDPNATTPKVDNTTSGGSGSGWVDYGTSGGGGRSSWKNYGSGGGGGGGYSSGGYSGGGGGGDMAAALAFLGDDFMGGRFKDMIGGSSGGDMSWESFLEDADGNGEFSASEIKAAKKKSKMGRGSRSRRTKPLSTSGRSANFSANGAIRKDVLERVEGMTPKTSTKGKKKS